MLKFEKPSQDKAKQREEKRRLCCIFITWAIGDYCLQTRPHSFEWGLIINR